MAEAAEPQTTPPSKRKNPLDAKREAEAVKALRESIAALDGDDALLLDTIEGETGLFEIIDALLSRMSDNRAMVQGIEAEEARLYLRRKRFEDRIKDDRGLIEQAMMIADIQAKIERPLATLYLSRRAPAVVVETEADIPAEFWKAADPTLDKKALAAALKEGRAIPGATLTNQAPTLSIRTA